MWSIHSVAGLILLAVALYLEVQALAALQFSTVTRASSLPSLQEFYCMLGPWARGRQKEVLAALKRLVQRVAGEANRTTTTRACSWTTARVAIQS